MKNKSQAIINVNILTKLIVSKRHYVSRSNILVNKIYTMKFLSAHSSQLIQVSSFFMRKNIGYQRLISSNERC